MKKNQNTNVNFDDEKKMIDRLVERVKKGDMDAFSEIYEFYVEKVYRYFFFKTSREESLDLTENVFLRVWSNIGKYKSKSNASFSAWLFRIARNLLIDHYRLSKPNLELDDSYPDLSTRHNPVSFAEKCLNKRSLKLAFEKLNDNHREVLTLSFLNGLSNEEIAGLLKKNEGTLRVLKYRALRELKKNLEDMGIEY